MKAQKPDTIVHISDIPALLAEPLQRRLFPQHLQLVPNLTEVYELELAFYESKVLTGEEIIHNGAYFARVGDRFTRHFLMCSGEPLRLPQHSSSRLKSFFSSNQFKTGYATHGLFPYRGKFHPQMIKALINIMGLKPGDTLLEPMMGSGTALIEARLMGIKSIGFDTSPFCRLMTQVKLDALTTPLDPVRQALKNLHVIYKFFSRVASCQSKLDGVEVLARQSDLFSLTDHKAESPCQDTDDLSLPPGWATPEVHDFLLLAYLDSAGYSERSSRRSPLDNFQAVLERYLFVAEKIQRTLTGTEAELADAQALVGDARHLPLPAETVDGVLFSPPYSFAIDYMKNDASHLAFLGVNQDELRERMIGLRGGNPKEQFNLYMSDMSQVLGECSRVLRPGRFCTIVVGTNTNQLSRILGVPPHRVPGLNELLADTAAGHNLRLVREMTRQITGIANTMRTESVIVLQKV